MIHNGHIYPLTIVADRYSGSYSGALYLAFNLDAAFLPSEIGGGDPEEMTFWEAEEVQSYNTHHDYIIGKGETPQEAYYDLLNKLTT